MSDETIEILPGEGDVKTVTSVRVRKTCEECGELATKKRTYLLHGARRNPASSAYGKDDCSWCSDHDVYTCDECRATVPDGFEECSTFSVGPRFAHMFLEWRECTTSPTTEGREP